MIMQENGTDAHSEENVRGISSFDYSECTDYADYAKCMLDQQRGIIMDRSKRFHLLAAIGFTLIAVFSGCTSWREYFHNGWKVGPNYCTPYAETAEHWIDADEVKTEDCPDVLSRWWMVFKDPKLNYLIDCAYHQNLSLKEAGFRILEARAQQAIAVGNIFPQSQTASGNYTRSGAPVSPGTTGVKRFNDSWNYGFNLRWELDFWGKFRRAIAAADANLDASVANFDEVLVTLLGDVADNYVSIRTTQERIKLLRVNVKSQQDIYEWINKRFIAGYKQTRLDLVQAESNLRQSEAGIPQLEIALRQSENALCILMGAPPTDLTKLIGTDGIPSPPAEVVIDIPANLIRRRPDVRRAEREAAAQAEQIGIAESELYPSFYINGSLGYTAKNFPDLFRSTAFNGNTGPSFQWNLLNYGRITNYVHEQEAAFQRLVVVYQNTVLNANKEVENGLTTFLKAKQRSKLLDESVVAADEALKVAVAQYENGAVDFNRYALIQQNLITQQDLSAQARGQITQGLITVYRALGGGWEIRLPGMHEPYEADDMPSAPLPGIGKAAEVVPVPKPDISVPQTDDTKAAPKPAESEKSAPNPPKMEKSEPKPADSEKSSLNPPKTEKSEPKPPEGEKKGALNPPKIEKIAMEKNEGDIPPEPDENP
jgi:NodT family efflux transporter outer membrane factor (OMF) lipoprotein